MGGMGWAHVPEPSSVVRLPSEAKQERQQRTTITDVAVRTCGPLSGLCRTAR